MFEKLKLYVQLNKIDGFLYVLPDGMYMSNSEYVKYSNVIKQIIGYSIGDIIKIIKPLSWKDWKCNFEKVVHYKSEPFHSVDVRDLSLDMVLEEINKMEENKNKNPFELFLEVFLIKSLMESLSNSKSLLGGIWSTGGILSGPHRYGKSSFAYFTHNIDEKNKIIIHLKQKLLEYPENFITSLMEYRSTSFNSTHSPYSTFLEFRILQIRYKIILQEICLHSSYLTADEKKQYDHELNNIKTLLASYPVKSIE